MPNASLISPVVREAFDLAGDPVPLVGGTVRVYRVGDKVIKPFNADALEHPRSLDLLPWLASQLVTMTVSGFRLSWPIYSKNWTWTVEVDGTHWTAWPYLAGRVMAVEDDVPAVIDAIYALHQALRNFKPHPLLAENDNPWGVADRHCWGNRPAWIHPIIAPLADQLYAQLEPLPDLPRQLIHSDLNLNNIVIAPDAPPGFIDLTPVFAPVDFAVAIFANWLGPRRGDVSRLCYFEAIPHFKQLLLRASLRMLLVVSELHGVDDWREEQLAAELVLAYVQS